MTAPRVVGELVKQGHKLVWRWYAPVDKAKAKQAIDRYAATKCKAVQS